MGISLQVQEIRVGNGSVRMVPLELTAEGLLCHEPRRGSGLVSRELALWRRDLRAGALVEN